MFTGNAGAYPSEAPFRVGPLPQLIMQRKVYPFYCSNCKIGQQRLCIFTLLMHKIFLAEARVRKATFPASFKLV